MQLDKNQENGQLVARELLQYPLELLRLVDVGSAGGVQDTWLPYADRVIPVLFEPNPNEAAKLRCMLQGGFNHALVMETGLSNLSETKKLNIARWWGCTSLREPNRDILSNYRIGPLFDVVDSTYVECKRYDELFKEGRVPAPDAIKVDVQGYEYEVLQGFGGLLQSCLAIELEAHLYPVYRNQKLLHHLVDFLADFNFVLRSTSPSTSFDGDVVELDARFTKNRQTWDRLNLMQKEKFSLICKAWNLVDYRRIDPSAFHMQISDP